MYQLLKPVADNIFETTHIFQDYTGYVGPHPCFAADTDCDGLDELAMNFPPSHRIYQWDVGLGTFVEGCTWQSSESGSLMYGHVLDLDQNGAFEWGTLDGSRILRALPDPDCVFCDSTGVCVLTAVDCFCYCHADPDYNGITDVLDVVQAVNVAFREFPPVTDPHPTCPYEGTDVDCDAKTDVLDVVRFVNVAFRNADPAVEFCDPCA
jgi:hypothetical protein